MNFYDEEKIFEIRQNKLLEQNGKCAACGKYFKYGEKIELAHCLPQRRYIIHKYGEEIIHHPLNMKLTHSGDCNSAVQMSPNKTELVEAHVNMIKQSIEGGRYEESKC